jgi:hypothetical protein
VSPGAGVRTLPRPAGAAGDFFQPARGFTVIQDRKKYEELVEALRDKGLKIPDEVLDPGVTDYLPLVIAIKSNTPRQPKKRFGTVAAGLDGNMG